MPARTVDAKGFTERSEGSWYTYIVECSDRTLYSGITKHPERRVREHNGERGGAKYTRSRRPVRLVHLEEYSCRSAAARRENELKNLSRREKQRLIKNRGDG